MSSNREHHARNFFQKGIHAISDFEKKAIDTILHRIKHQARDEKKSSSFGERLADRVASFGGSWTFIMLFCGLLVAWVILNSVLLPIMLQDKEGFDPYPYILLNLFLSMLAAIQAPIIMMSQNRQAANDRKFAKDDFEINLKSEMEILALHEKVDDIRVTKWEHLLEIQQNQIEMLTQVFQKHIREDHDKNS